eukprot:m.322158 g.322158  ORF g.322158 m.322158 type:complete len:55 (+) comp20346_c0_seq13:897-1061(+)
MPSARHSFHWLLPAGERSRLDAGGGGCITFVESSEFDLTDLCAIVVRSINASGS